MLYIVFKQSGVVGSCWHELSSTQSCRKKSQLGLIKRFDGLSVCVEISQGLSACVEISPTELGPVGTNPKLSPGVGLCHDRSCLVG